MAYLVQQLVNGLTLGAIYGLTAIGYTMVYGIIGLINFAHGEIVMMGAFAALVGFLVCSSAGLHSAGAEILIVLPLTMLVCAGWAALLERVAYRPVRASLRLAPLISAIGASIFLQNFVQLLQGTRPKPLPALVSGGVSVIRSGAFTARVSYLQIAIVLGTAAVMAAFTLVIGRTALGRRQRACAEDRVMAELLGIDVDRTIAVTFMLGGALAAVAGLMFDLYYGVVDPFVGFALGIKSFTAAVAGGIGSLPGAMLGGLLIGLVEALWSGYGSIEYKDVAVFAVLVLVLILRPSGLLGRREAVKV